MTYLVDGRSLQDRSSVRGIGTYLRGLLSGFAELGVSDEVELLLRGGAPIPEEVKEFALHRSRAHIPGTKRRLQPVADPFLVATVLRRLKPDLYHGVEYAQPVRTTVPVVITVHDLIPFVFPQKYAWMRRERLLALRLLRNADALIADSAATAHDMAIIAGVDEESVTVVPLGVAPHFAPAPSKAIEAMRARHSLGDRPYVLAVGTFDPRKRIDLLSDAVATIRKDHDVDLVIAGSQGDYDSAVVAAVEEAGIAPHTQLLGYVSREDLVALYSGCQALLFTSEYEGFGLPPLEAMACGAPVAMFANSSLLEVAGDAAILVNDGDAKALGKAVSKLIGDPKDRERRVKAGIEWARHFTWKRTALDTLKVYERVLRSRS